MTARPRVITGALYVDMGRQLQSGRWVEQPRARYECLRCRTVEGPVTGPSDVAEFVAAIRATHQTHCNPNHEGAQAA